ncbi:MAG: MFS transporter [Amnibacterium sp.]
MSGPGAAPTGPRRLIALLSALRPDLSPLKASRDYRRLYASSAVSLLGSMVTAVAAPVQLKVLTGSTVAVGLVGIAELVPTVVLGLWGGAVADVHDRKRVLVITEAIALLAALALVGNALLPSPSIAAIYVAAAGAAGASAVQRPSAEAMLARLIPREQQAAAAALLGLQGNFGMILGPALGGVLAAVSLPAAYAVNVATFLVSILLMLTVTRMRAEGGADPVSLRGIGEGLRYAARRRDLLGTYLVDIAAMAFAMPEALYPFLADELHASSALGLLYAAGAIGSGIVTLTGGWMTRVQRHGRAIVLAAACWGAAIALAGVAPGLLLTVLCLMVAGGADMVSGVFRDAIWNSTIPDALRGRLAGIELLSYSTGPTLGNARAGLMARFTGVRGAILGGGLLCMAGVAVAASALPALWRQHADDPVPEPA